MIRTFTLRGWAALVLAAFAPPLTPVLAGAMPTLALVNETSSLPRGLYLRRFGADIRRDATAAAAQPKAARAYLESLGASADLLLLKRVAADPDAVRAMQASTAYERTTMDMARDVTALYAEHGFA